MKNSICTGSVVHYRQRPRKHKFKYKMSWCLIDLDQITKLCDSSWFWSQNRFNLVSFFDKDYINETQHSIKDKAKNFIKEQTGKDFEGKILLFSHPRYLGFGFNSVNFYFCYHNNKLIYILSEINNTPWKQKHIYFHNFETQEKSAKNQLFKTSFKKQFHISPFVDMDIDYDWKFMISDHQVNVFMKLSQNDSVLMTVGLNTERDPISSSSLWKWSLSKPFQSLKMFTGIYWQALKLWAKKIPFFNHPETEEVKQ